MRRRNPQRHPEPMARQAGYTLPELAICICILGLLLGGGITDTARYFAKRKSDETHRRIDLVMNELSAYVQTHNRLPCPADPAAQPDQAGHERDGGHCYVPGQTRALAGAVPWKELAIPQAMVMDAQGHYINYAPAPWLTADKQAGANIQVGNACRSAAWYDDAGQPLDRARALFCCAVPPGPAQTPAMTVADAQEAADIEPAAGGPAADVKDSGSISVPHYMDGPDSPLLHEDAMAVTLTGSSGGPGAPVTMTLRADQLYARVGHGSCESPPAAAARTYSCVPQSFSHDGLRAVKDPATGTMMPPPTLYGVQMALTGQNYTLRATLTRHGSSDGRADSLGFYLVKRDGSIDGVHLLVKDVRAWPDGQTVSLYVPWENGIRAVGLFVVPDGFRWMDGYKDIDLDHLKFVANYGFPGEKPATVSDQSPPTLVSVDQTGAGTPVRGAGGLFSAYHLYSNLNPGHAGRLLRADTICHMTGEKVGPNHDIACNEPTNVTEAGIDPAHPGFAMVGFEEGPGVNCYELKKGGCAPGGNLAAADLIPDDEGGYVASVGDNSYDDLAFSIGLAACPQLR